MSVLNNLTNTNYYISNPDENFSTVHTLSAKYISAYKDDYGNAQSLFIGATSNLMLEAVDKIATYVKDSGLVSLNATTLSNNNRADVNFLNMYYNSNAHDTVLAAPGGKSISIVSTDSNLTASISGIVMCNDTTHQFLVPNASQKGFNLMGPGAQMSNLLVHNHIFGKDMMLWEKFPDASNVGQTKEAGYTFRLNSNLQLELIKYNKMITATGTKSVYKRVGVFGNTGSMNSDSDSNLATYTVYDDVVALINVNSGSNVGGSNVGGSNVGGASLVSASLSLSVNAKDTSGFWNNVTYYGNVATSASGGYQDGPYVQTSPSGYFGVPNSIAQNFNFFSYNGLTLCAFFRIDALNANGNDTIVLFWHNSTHEAVKLCRVATEEYMTFVLRDPGTGNVICSPDVNVSYTVGTYVKVIIRYTNSTSKCDVFIDSTLNSSTDTQNTLTSDASVGSGDSIYISYQDYGAFQGDIASVSIHDLRIYDGPLSDTQIAGVFSSWESW